MSQTIVPQICADCNLPEDGLRTRNVTTRPHGEPLCADCARIQAQEDYIANLATEKGMTVEALGNRIMYDLMAGVPDRQTMIILTNMFHAAERVNGRSTASAEGE